MLERVFVCTFFVFLYLLVFKHLESPALPFLSLLIVVVVVVFVVGGGGDLLCGFTLFFPRGLGEFFSSDLIRDTEIFLLTFFKH